MAMAALRPPEGGRWYRYSVRLVTNRLQTPAWFFALLLLTGVWKCTEILVFIAGSQRSIAWPHDDDGVLHEPPTAQSTDSDRLPHLRRTRRHMDSPLNDVTNVPIPTHEDGSALSLEERLRYLELKTNAHFNFGAHPFFGNEIHGKCARVTDLKEYGCVEGNEGYNAALKPNDDQNCPGLFDHQICLDRLPEPHDQPSNSCLIYDFGIRKQPEFGKAMATVFGCEVHAFDPSPVSTRWWEAGKRGGTSAELHDMQNYHFHPYGAGGVDGDLELNEYDWGQVSIINYPNFKVDCTQSTGENCELINVGDQRKKFKLPVKTLPTIMKELGHEGRTIDVLKIDVEGSEFAFLENIFDRTGGCPDFIEQVSVEWHHMPWDVRYGEGSSPSINVMATLLHTCGLKMFWRHMSGGWPSNQKIFQDLDMKDVRYSLASFNREHWTENEK